MYQKWPDNILPIVNFVVSRCGHLGLVLGGGTKQSSPTSVVDALDCDNTLLGSRKPRASNHTSSPTTRGHKSSTATSTPGGVAESGGLGHVAGSSMPGALCALGPGGGGVTPPPPAVYSHSNTSLLFLLLLSAILMHP